MYSLNTLAIVYNTNFNKPCIAGLFKISKRNIPNFQGMDSAFWVLKKCILCYTENDCKTKSEEKRCYVNGNIF